MNTRLSECSGYESPQAAESWLSDWVEKVFEKLDLPQKFLLAGHSYGCYLASLYAGKFPKKILSFYMISPAGVQPYNAKTYNPY